MYYDNIHEHAARVSRKAHATSAHDAIIVLSGAQQAIGLGLAAAVFALFLTTPSSTLTAINTLFAAYFLASIFFRTVLMASAATLNHDETPIANPYDPSLPVITILAPLYREAESLAALVQAIEDLSYPAEKKDVIFLLEADDTETIREATRLSLQAEYDVMILPESLPKTKPKACNIGLAQARGELIVIYDAEDQPERDQLLKAVGAFREDDDELACVQARLNYYNTDDNWLTRMFTIEYTLWFDWLLPAMQRFQIPIPLGGTSNFIKTAILRKVGGWDPYNVTEDADLGLRLYAKGYRTRILDSTTYEEASSETANWIRQRSRWIKGYLQTWLVHMRRPEDIIRTTGWRGFATVQLLIAGAVFCSLTAPLLWIAAVAWPLFATGGGSSPVTSAIVAFSVASLIGGNLIFILSAAAAPLKRNRPDLSLYALTIPLYWVLISIAAFKGVFQLVRRPHFWEKTEHAISRKALIRRDAALAHLTHPYAPPNIDG